MDKPVLEYEARVVNEQGDIGAAREMGRHAMRGPTGCRDLRGESQTRYVMDGWNIIGDRFWRDEDGDFHFAARDHDIIASPGEPHVTALPHHIKATIASCKHPRSIVFVDAMPKTQTVKMQRFRLKPPPRH